MSDAPVTFTQDEIGEAGKPWDLGTYTARLLDVQVKDNPDPNRVAIQAIFQVTSGDKKDEDLHIYRSLAVYQTKKGGWFAPGLMEIKADLKAVDGLEAGEKLTREPNEARKQYAKGLARKEVTILVYNESYTDRTTGEKKTVAKKKVTGLVGGNAAAPAANLGLA